MDDEIYVSCHAPCFSLLLFETVRSRHDQKGLLIGQICDEVISRKTDENEVNCERKTAIYLEHCIPIDDPDIFGNAGIISKNKLQKYIDISQNKIVGWYSFRRNTRLVPNSISESLIHQSLLELLPNVKCQYFVACFMSSNVAFNMSTHTFNHIFMTYDSVKDKFEPVRLKIYTLSDKSVNSNGYSIRNPFPTSSNFKKIINHVQNEETPVKSVLAIHERVSEVLKQTDKKLQNTEIKKLQLKQEVEALKQKLGINNNQEIMVKEPQKEELESITISFDPSIKYNSSRKVNPLKAVILKPLVPEEKRKQEPKKSYSSATKSSASPLTLTSKTKEEHKKSSTNAGVSSPSLPFFPLDPPKNKPDLSPLAVKTNNLMINNCDVDNVIGSSDDDSEKKISKTNNFQPQKPMEF